MTYSDQCILELISRAVRHAGERGHSFLSTHVGYHGLNKADCKWRPNELGGVTITARCLNCNADLVIQTGSHPMVLGFATHAYCQECCEDEICRALAQGFNVTLHSLEATLAG